MIMIDGLISEVLRYSRVWVIVWFMIIVNSLILLLGFVDMVIIGNFGDVVFFGVIVFGVFIFNFVYWMFGFICMGMMGLIV